LFFIFLIITSLNFDLFISIPIPTLFNLFATIAVVKLPAKGSSTFSPLYEKKLIACSGISSGNGAVCPSLFIPLLLILITGVNFTISFLHFFINSSFILSSSVCLFCVVIVFKENLFPLLLLLLTKHSLFLHSQL